MFTSPLNFHNKIKVSDYLHLRENNQGSETDKIICSRSYNKWVGELQNSCFQSLPSKYSMDSKEIEPVNPKGNQSWMFIGRTDVEAETPILWPPDVNNWLIWKDPNAGKNWREEKGMTGWNGWMASLTQWTWVWASSGRWWRTGKSGVLQSMGFRRVGHNWATEWQSMFSYGSLHTYTHTPIPNYVFLQS